MKLAEEEYLKDDETEVTKEKEDMAYDDVLVQLGEFGRYQRRIYFLLCLPAISCALHKLVGVFLQARVPHRCRLPWEDKDSSYHIEYSFASLYPWDTSIRGYSSCQSYSISGFHEIDNSTVVKCNSWIYDSVQYRSSTLTEWDLVCDRAWLKATADAIFMIGVLLGSIIFGDLSDRFGRRPIFFISLILQVFAGVAAGLAVNYVMFVVCRMLVGAATSGVFLVAYVLALEMVGPKKRMFAGVACQFFFTTGYIMTAGFAYFLRNWRWLQIAVSVPGVVFFSYWWFIPESARWLLTKGRQEEAEKILMKAAKENKAELPRESIKSLLEAGERKKSNETFKQPTVLDLFKFPNLRKKSLTIFFLWFVNSATYYGLSWNTGNLAGNEYINFIISGLVEYPAYVFLLLTLNRWGRKLILCGSMALAGLALLFNIFVPAGMSWLTVTLAMVGKLAISASYGVVYIYSAEQFPTVIRNVGLGASSTFARFGGILAPYINISAELFPPMPLIVFGFLALAAVVFSLFLPETHNRKLPDTIEDGENFGKKRRTTLADQGAGQSRGNGTASPLVQK